MLFGRRLFATQATASEAPAAPSGATPARRAETEDDCVQPSSADLLIGLLDAALPGGSDIDVIDARAIVRDQLQALTRL